jgi:hypothetical protein
MKYAKNDQHYRKQVNSNPGYDVIAFHKNDFSSEKGTDLAGGKV